MTADDPMRRRWDDAHDLPRFRPRYPHEQVVRWAFSSFDRKATKAKILDLGCGAGRHAVFFAQEQFVSYGCDLSESGLRETARLAAQKDVSVALRRTVADDLSSYPDDMFDGLLCFGVLYYLTEEGAQRAIREVFRVLKPGGKCMVVVRTDEDSRKTGAVPLGGASWRLGDLGAETSAEMEAGMAMLFYTRADIAALFSPFTHLAVDRMTYIHNGFRDDDWVVTASKP